MQKIDWLRERQASIGASEAADLVGLGFGSASKLFLAKTTPINPLLEEIDEGPMAAGNELEPNIAAKYSRRMGCDLIPKSPWEFEIARHPDRAWQTCSPDVFRRDGGYVQLKSPGIFDEQWGPSGSDVIPDAYQIQVQQEMGVLCLDHCDLAALSRLDWQFRVYRIAFNPAFFAWLTAVEERFMTEHLIPRIAPGPEWDAQFSQAPELAAIIRGKSIDLGSEVAELLEQRAVYKSIRDEADDEYSRLNGCLAALMGDSQRAYAEGPAGAWKLSQVEIGEKQIPAHTSRGYRYVRATPTKRRGLAPIGAKTMPALMAEIAAGMELTDPLSNLETS